MCTRFRPNGKSRDAIGQVRYAHLVLSGEMHGKMHDKNCGETRGAVFCTALLEIEPTARIIADVQYPFWQCTAEY
jgi:hypothetical protein